MVKPNAKPKSTPSTTTITPSSLSSNITLFSPSTLSATPYYAHLHRAPDAHTLRIYDVLSDKCISRWASNAVGDESEEERVNCIAWALIPVPSQVEESEAEVAESSKRGKKRRKSDGAAGSTQEVKKIASPKLILTMGLESGSIITWSPNGSMTSTLSHPTSTAAITSLAVPEGGHASGHLWSTQSDGEVRVWDLATGQLAARVTSLVPESTRWDDSAVRYLADAGGKKTKVQLLLSHLSLHVFSLSIAKVKGDKVKDIKAAEIGRCTGHVEAGYVQFTNLGSASNEDVVIADSDDDEGTPSISFLSYSSTDRFVQLWSLTLPTTPTRNEGKLVARLGLESGVRSLALANSALDKEEEVIVAVDAQGRVALARLPASFPIPEASSNKKSKAVGVIVLEIESEVVGRNGESASITSVGIDDQSNLSLCRGGVKPVFEIIKFAGENGSWSPKIELDRVAAGLLNRSAMDEDASAPATSRYTELAASTVRSGDALLEANSDDEDLMNTGELDVDMAEPTLADRLKAMNVNKAAMLTNGVVGGEGEGDAAEEDDEEEDDEIINTGPSVPSATLTTTLIQALHSADAPLLESCLSHTSPTLIRATVKRLSSGSLVLTLLEALVDRLGKGKKGRQGNASVKRSRGLIEWVRQTLIVHVGFLVTIPSLVTRLSTLHASLTSRLALQPTLLALNGRLELVMSQIDLRQERVAAQASIGATQSNRSNANGGSRYVEGESESESDNSEVGIEDDEEEEEDDAEVEDVILGSDRSDEDDEEDDEEDSEEEEDENDLPKKISSKQINGKRAAVTKFLDLEASDEDEDEEGDSDDEEDDFIDDDESEDDV